MIDFSLSEQQKAFQKTARDFAQKEIAPVALDYDKNPRFPAEIIQKAHAAGLMNLTCPPQYGGHGLGHILENAVPAMRRRGMIEEQINDLLVDNPKHFFTFK